jgi:hypothetical protein
MQAEGKEAAGSLKTNKPTLFLQLKCKKNFAFEEVLTHVTRSELFFAKILFCFEALCLVCQLRCCARKVLVATNLRSLTMFI